MPADDFESHLEAALVTRPLIEQAKGILVGVRCENPDQAFAELRHVSQQHNVKLSALAEALVEVSAGREVDDPLLREVIWQEWGVQLPNC